MRIASGKPRGRPTKKTPQAIARILKVARTGLPLKFAAQAGDIDEDTLVLWRANDPEFAHALSHARLAAVEDRWGLIKKAALGTEEKPGDWRAVAWQLERAYPGDFARPEVALSLIAQNNVTQNYLSISITGEQAREIEAQARPIRESVQRMIEQYRPQASGNGETGREVKVEPVVEQPVQEHIPQAAEQALITHKAGDEKSQEFWRMLVTGDPEKALIARETAIWAARTILVELMGFKAHRTEIDFGSDPVRLSDLLALLEKLSGPSGWQLMQRKAAF